MRFQCALPPTATGQSVIDTTGKAPPRGQSSKSASQSWTIPNPTLEDLSEEQLQFFADRGISPAVVERNNIKQERLFCPPLGTVAPALVFPYYRCARRVTAVIALVYVVVVAMGMQWGLCGVCRCCCGTSITPGRAAIQGSVGAATGKAVARPKGGVGCCLPCCRV